MTYGELVGALDSLADPSVAAYQNKVVSDTKHPMRCIRVPVLRRLAKQAAAGEWRTLLSQARFDTYEEVLVLGLAIAYAKVPFADKIEPLRELLPHLDSWALTDSIVPTLRIGQTERELAWTFAAECLADTREYTIRFGIIMLLDYFLTAEDIPRVARKLTDIRDERYYVRMAVAWCLAEMAVHAYLPVEKILRSGELDVFTHNMTIRKMRESYRITREQKAACAALKRKER